MKSFISFICVITILLALIGCGSTASSSPSPTNSNNAVSSASPSPTLKGGNINESKLNLPSGTKEMGNGKIETVTASNNSNTGTVPVLFVGNDTKLEQLGLNSIGFDGSKLSYVFIDSLLNSKEQLGDSQITLNLKGQELKVGKHNVEVVQYDTDKITGKIITYKTGSYEVKAK